MGRNHLKLEIRDLSSERQPNNCRFLISHSTFLISQPAKQSWPTLHTGGSARESATTRTGLTQSMPTGSSCQSFFTSFRNENLCSTARANDSVALESEIEGGVFCAASFTIVSRICSCSCSDRTCFQPLCSIHRFNSSKTSPGYSGWASGFCR